MIYKRKIVIANWKMNPETTLDAKKIFNDTRSIVKNLKNTDVVICPPFVYLSNILKLDYPKNMSWGVQNIAIATKGAFTGEISTLMVKDIGANYVIVGHSERRAMGETNEIIKSKLEIVFNTGLTPILCVGEKVRDKEGTHLEFIKNQIKECLSGLPKKNLLNLIIAYEPVWAIGKSYKESMGATDVHEMTLFIEKVAGEIFGKDIASSFTILYGGSVEAENAKSIITYGNVRGFLVGHASLVKEQFSAILEAVDLKK